MIHLCIFFALMAILFALARVIMVLEELTEVIKVMMHEGDDFRPPNHLPCFPCRIHDN